MYFSEDVILDALKRLAALHPFFGITFLACKQGKLPIGTPISFPVASLEEEILKTYYHPSPRSVYYFHPFRTSGSRKWLSPKYPSAGSQSTRTRGDFARAFIHKRGTDLWGWESDYVAVLQGNLEKEKTNRIPAFALASWLYRSRDWPEGTSAHEVVNVLYRDFAITSDERGALFDESAMRIADVPMLSVESFSDDQLLRVIPRAPDAVPDEGGTLRRLQLRGVGPADQLSFAPGEHLTVITGDNGLGKTFLLETAWWSLTGNWAERPLHPRLDSTTREPSLSFEIAGRGGGGDTFKVDYDWDLQAWPTPKRRPLLPGLVIYARVDGSFAVWDPARHVRTPHSVPLTFTRSQVLNGLDGKIEGLIRDWINWQNNPDRRLFDRFSKVLTGLSPPDFPLSVGPPIRLPDEPREVPTLQHSYGIVPFTSESAAIKRIATLAYLLVWAWNEHEVAAGLARRPAQRKMVLLVDEVEAHLHPKWQRRVLPAVLDVMRLLSEVVEPQIIVATHSPLVLSSLETRFRDETDKLFHLHLNTTGQVSLDEVAWVRYGNFDNWLTSDIFELRQPRSIEAETVIEAARSLMGNENPQVESVGKLNKRLEATLPPDDEFWPRWRHFAEMKGVTL